MKLEKKKSLAAKTLEVGKNRIVFNTQRLSDIKEAITKQDIRDLFSDGAILLRAPSGRKKIIRRKYRRKAGSVKKPVKNGKREYVMLTRKLRAYVAQLRRLGKLPREEYYALRKEIKSKSFKSKAQLKERISETP